jgi:spore germination protein PE
MIRTAIVGDVQVRSLLLSSVVHVGEIGGMFPDSRIFAVQREQPVFLGNEGNLEQFPIFRQSFARIQSTERVELDIHNRIPAIRVRKVDIYGISASSVLQIGNVGVIDATNRTKHIRQLLPDTQGIDE